MGKTSQRKGAEGERELARILCSHGYEIKRGGSLSYGTVPDLYGLQEIHIEVKRVERLNLWTAMSQSIEDAERFNDGMPTVFHRQSSRPWLVTMRLDDWLKLYKK